MQYLIHFMTLCLFVTAPVNHAVSADSTDKLQRWKSVSTKEQFQAVTGPSRGRVKIGQFQQWELRLLDKTGKPVYPVRISIDGGMPGHGHGLPTRPQITKYLGDGRWQIEGVKLNMAGEWMLVFAVQTENASDRVNFIFTVDF